MKSLIKNEKGATLIFTLVVFVFVSIIATAVISVATNEKIHSIDKNKEIQARYNAISGIEIMTEYITEYTDEFNITLDDYGLNYPLVKTIKDGEFSIEIDTTLSSGIKLISTGTYHDKNVVVNRFFEEIDITHDFLFGEFFIDTTIYTDYDPVVIPTPSDVDLNDLTVSNGEYNEQVLTNETTEYEDIDVNTNGELSFKSHPSAPTTRNVVVDTIDVNGTFNFTDDGRIFLFVKTKANFNSEFLPANENLIIMLASGAELVVNINDKSAPFYAYVYGPDATVDLFNHYGFHGAIIASNLKNPGANVEENYVPPTKTLDMLNFIDYKRVYSYEPKRYMK